MEIAKQIKRYRKKEKYSQEELAEQLYISRQAVSNWERGLSEPDLDTIRKLADIFHTSIEELITGDEVEDRQLKTQTYINWFFIAGVFLCVVNIIMTIMNAQSNTAIVLPLIITFMIGIVVVIFGYALRNREYSMLAGYEPDIRYNERVLRQMLLSVQISIVSVYIFTMILSLAGIWFQSKEFIIIVMMINVINLIVSVLGFNIRYRDTLFLDKKQRNSSSKGTMIVILYVVVLILSVCAAVYTFKLHHIQNNTPEAHMVLGVMSPGLIYHTI